MTQSQIKVHLERKKCLPILDRAVTVFRRYPSRALQRVFISLLGAQLKSPFISPPPSRFGRLIPGSFLVWDSPNAKNHDATSFQNSEEAKVKHSLSVRPINVSVVESLLVVSSKAACQTVIGCQCLLLLFSRSLPPFALFLITPRPQTAIAAANYRKGDKDHKLDEREGERE